jgi:uncharacterized protein YqeY
MTLSAQLSNDLNTALKTKDTAKVSILRMIKAEIKNREIDKGEPLADDEVMAVLKSFVKKGRESIEQFTNAGREELASKEKEELEAVMSYLPEQLSEDDMKKIVKETIAETGAEGAGDFGNVMKAVMAKAKGKADGKIISGLVKKALEEG